MTKTLIAVIGAVIGAAIAVFATTGVGFGSTTVTRFTNPVTFVRDITVSGGTLNVTTSNSATSTLVVGCIEFYATSTATAHKFQASTTPGDMVSQYGACPRL